MSKFRTVHVSVQFSLSVPADEEFSYILNKIDAAQWGMLLEFAAKNNMCTTRPLISTKSTSLEDDNAEDYDDR